jgi:Tfp pilus assembly protein PilO
MEDKNLKPGENAEETKPQIHVNEYGGTKDSAVVVDEAKRTVLLTEDETIVIEKSKMIDVPPKNRERKIYAGMWGTTELVTVGLSLLAILTTILVFVLLVLPAQSELNTNRAKRDELDKDLSTAKSRYGNITTTEERVAQLITSVDEFEARYLPAQTTGQNALYQQINGLIAAYGLTNTSGPDYSPLEIVDPNRTNQQTEEQKGRAKFISIYPGTYITMTLDGSYQNLRRFISEIERNSNQFVVISTVELEPSENKEKIDPTKQPQTTQINQPGAANPGGFQNPTLERPQFNPQLPTQPAAKVDRGKTRGETVTLRLEMATYFRRSGAIIQPQSASLVR